MTQRPRIRMILLVTLCLVPGCPAEPRTKPARDVSLPQDASSGSADSRAPLDARSSPSSGTDVDLPEALPFDAADCQHPPVQKDCTDGWCRIPAGCFVMGSPEDEWYRASVSEERTKVTLTHSFVIQAHEVTQRDWTAHALPNPSGKMADGTGDCLEADCPVGNVTWIEALAYANLLSQQNQPPLPPCYELSQCQGEIGKGYVCGAFKTTAATLYDCEGFRLPTRAEWEYAARAGTGTAFYDGPIQTYSALDCHPDPNLERIGWYCYNSAGSTHPVGLLEPNAWGLYDTSGNADEWVNDKNNGLPPSPPVDPGATLDNTVPRITRGGLFNSLSPMCRSAAESVVSFYAHGPGLGFRLVRTIQ